MDDLILQIMLLNKLDIVGVAIHSNFAQPLEVQTERLVKAAENPSVDILFHPTGRLINKRWISSKY